MVLTYNYNEERPNKDWVLKIDANIDGDCLSYLDMVERSNFEERRRHKERIMMEEGKALWNAKKNEELEIERKEQEQIRDLSKRGIFGKPGHGAPTSDIRKKKFTEYQFNSEFEKEKINELNDVFSNHVNPYYKNHRDNETKDSSSNFPSVLTFGRAGNGAPVRSKSGRVLANLVGNAEIRFQNNEAVQKSINNSIRYHNNREEKESYHHFLEEQIKTRKLQEREEKERNKQFAVTREQMEGSQWGKPGPGGTYWRNSAVTGQGFFDKMGWSVTDDPRRRQFEIKSVEVEDMKKQIDEIRSKKEFELVDMNSGVGVELVPLIKDKLTGKPRKDPVTGYMMSHPLPSTDVTKIIDSKRDFNEEKKRYFESLISQVNDKEFEILRLRETENEEQKRHFENWSSFWGRPGCGAPQDGRRPHKENLMKILHYSSSSEQNTPNNVELITLERLPK